MTRLLLVVLVASWLLAPRASAVAQAVQSPDAVVRSLYRVHNHGYGHVFERSGKRYIDRYFDRPLAALLWHDIAHTPAGDVGNLDFDPLYNAQDFQITRFQVGSPHIRGSTATVTAAFRNFGKPVQIVFRMHRTAAGWKIADVDYGGGSTLTHILRMPA